MFDYHVVTTLLVLFMLKPSLFECFTAWLHSIMELPFQDEYDDELDRQAMQRINRDAE